MSELVEKVARALYPTWWETVDKCPDGADCESCSGDRTHSLGKARAGIIAVLEHYSDIRNAGYIVNSFCRAELERLKGGDK